MLQLSTCKDAESVAQTLQIYFFESPVRELSARIPPDFVTRTLELVLFLLPHMKPASEHYVRQKLNTRTLALAEAVREAMAEEVPPEARYAVLEHDLRMVVVLLRYAQTLNPPQLQAASTLLGPLWDYRSTKH